MSGQMSLADEWKRFALVLTVGAIAGALGTFLPPDDYQPSRPLWAGGLLLAGLAAFWFIRGQIAWVHSATKWLAVMFGALFLFTLFM